MLRLHLLEIRHEHGGFLQFDDLLVEVHLIQYSFTSARINFPTLAGKIYLTEE